jgi:hypothetical protein
MSTDRDATTRIVRSWLHEDAHEDADRILNLVLDEIETTPQRRSPWLTRSFPTMKSNGIGLGIAAAVVGLAVFLGVNYPWGSHTGAPPEPSQSPSAAATPRGLPFTNRELESGTYSLTQFPVSVTFDIPPGWFSCSEGPAEQGVCHRVAEGTPGVGVAFVIVDNVVADPCTTSDEMVDPPVGPSVEDLVTALVNLEGFEITPVMDITVGGFSGKQFSMTAPGGAACELKTWASERRTNTVGPGEVNLLRIIDVDGVRVVISGSYFPDAASEAAITDLEQVMASVHFAP